MISATANSNLTASPLQVILLLYKPNDNLGMRLNNQVSLPGMLRLVALNSMIRTFCIFFNSFPHK